MAVDDTAPRHGPVALADLFDAALKDLAPRPSPPTPTRMPTRMPIPAPSPATPAASGDAFLFSGFIDVPADGEYTFTLPTGATALLRIHDATVIDCAWTSSPTKSRSVFMVCLLG